MMNRRDVVKQGAMAAAGAFVAGRVNAQETGEAKFFPGFKPFKVKTTGAEINGVTGGSGPPILLLHGAPQSHITWRLVAPKLAATRTVIVHVIGPENGATLPGMTVVCGDSHTSTHGAFAALAHGIGTSEVEHVLATQCMV